ncbi:MAG: type II secretion system protein, partial [Cyanobacteriota bacterium]
MAVRALNVDLALLTNNVNNQANGLIGGDTWLPAGIEENREGGIFYAFREDAVREDAIARPPLGNFAGYQTAWRNNNARGELGSAGVMNAGQPGRGTVNNQTVWDPPVSNVPPDNTGLSPKPVDYYADPDRRPYGFRLRNGAVLRRGGLNPDEAIFGLSFISDNPVYIQGDFNLHQDANGNRLEEFTNLLTFGGDGLYNNFYGRLRQNENANFARALGDLWRPTDILGDSVNILSSDFCDGSIDDGLIQDGTLNGGGSSFVANRDYQSGRASAPRRNQYYGCTGPNLGANTSFLNQALVIRGNNWPAPDPNNTGAGVLRFDNTGGAQNLGNNTNQPGWPDLFARDTVFARFDNTDGDPSNDDRTAGGGVPQVRQLRAPDLGYAAFGTRISALGNPVIDTSRWVMVAPPGPCPVPNGSGLLAEYYNGWLSSPQNQYNRNGTNFAATGNAGPLDSAAQTANLPYLRSVRWPDPIYPGQGIPESVGAFTGAPTCSLASGATTAQRWACVRDAINNVSNLAGFARSEGSFPSWGGFNYQFGGSGSIDSNSPFKRRLYNNALTSCNGSLADILLPTCRLSVPILSPPNPWPPVAPFSPPDPNPDRRDRGDFFWDPSCGEPETGGLVIDADDIGYSYAPLGNPRIAYNNNPPNNGVVDFTFEANQFNHLRSCWRRRSGGSPSGNSQGNDFFVVRWVGELYPRYPGLVNYRLNTDDGGRIVIRRRDASTATFRNASAGSGTFLNLGPNAAGVESWFDSGNAQTTLRVELECADPAQPSPYLVEIQAYENGGNAFVRFSTNPDGQPAESYDLRYLKPRLPVNKPCEPDQTKTVKDSSIQRNCAATLNCTPIWSGWSPACDTTICVATTITQTKTASLPPGCPGTAPTPQTQLVTCQPQFTYGTWSSWSPACTQTQQCNGTKITQTRTRTVTPLCTANPPFTETGNQTITCSAPSPTCGSYSAWEPACTVANGGTKVTQTRSRTCTSVCKGSYTESQSQTVTCPATCNYEYGPWSPTCDSLTIACGTSQPLNQTRTGTLAAGSSPTCSATKTETQTITCTGKPCGPTTFAPDSPFNTPLGERVAVKPNTLDLRPVWEIEVEPEPETISVNTVAAVPPVPEGVTIALQPELSPVLEVKAAKVEPHWPSVSEALQAAFNWVFGEPAYAARNGLTSGLLSSQIANPSKEPGIRPAENIGAKIPGTPAAGTDNWARQLRRQLLNSSGEIRCGEEEVNPIDKGFWVPGVFRPNFNTTFKYTAYTGASRPSTLKFVPDPKDPTVNIVVDRDPLFGNIPGVQPQMVLNPYARVNNATAQTYTPTSTYLDGYYIDDKGVESIQNGLCFYVKPSGNAIQIQVDRNGSDGGQQEWVNVEPFTLNINAATTGFAGTNPVLGVILDEVTRRPIPIPNFQEL